MKAGKSISLLILSFGLLVSQTVGIPISHAFIPGEDEVVNPPKKMELPAYDLWGRSISHQEAKELLKTREGQELLSPQNGAVRIDDALLKLGRKTFYEETFENEYYLSDILGVVNGPLTVANMKKAIRDLKGEGTTNLRVELAEDIKIGERLYRKGEKIDTGLDVVKGSQEILGIPFKAGWDGREKVGMSCVACHATVDPVNKRVIEGAPNTDANWGLLVALGTNSAGYYARSDIAALQEYISDNSKTVTTTDGKKAALPDPQRLEEVVDAGLVKWPKGNFDVTSDFINNSTQTPDSFTLGDHPYSWSGFAMAGSFKGLSVLNSTVNVVGSDLTSLADASPALFGIDKEVYLGTVLQNAANPAFRYDPSLGLKPSEFFAKIDPTKQAPGLNQMVKLPTFPRPSMVAVNGLVTSSPGTKVMEQNHALSALQNSLVPPKAPVPLNQKLVEEGQSVFRRASCINCHAGDFLTNNRIIPAPEIGTEPTRAAGLKRVGNLLAAPVIYSPDTPVPVPENARVLKVPTDHLDPEQIKLAFAQGDSPGGYKVPSLIGLYWSAPYLHDGGVAVGTNPKTELGIPGTHQKGILPDPMNSLRALVDKKLREKVVQANLASKDLQDAHITGKGHEYWVDESTGFTPQEQEALLQYLLSQ